MGDIFDLIFSNIGILLPIIFGVFAFLTNLGKDDEKEQKKKPVQNPPRQRETTPSSPEPSVDREKVKDLKTYAEEQRERYRSLQREQKDEGPDAKPQEQKAFKGEIGGEHDAIPDQPTQPSYQRDEKVPYRKERKPQPSVKVSGLQNVSKKKLAESVVMAEVLGKPRSMNPYRSHLKK
ncbi:hypothetical protein IMZ31_13020 [Pontibacillus sp. ALD_SL1]|uniref:hypothetical protein n=1 Tax=Pontibacillus sp. ALD_SL1 TaxID=2777185 RepID=UPI001A95AA61|nr:hypothetical protein [Pontibacillus sp. ALD_SL1]QSS99000.1 hypothetical protein IMZ31_13020 [Pontibacillus sp. ALD_SL1]